VALRDRIQRARAERQRSEISERSDGVTALALALFDAGCIRFGQFTLASGAQSPVYVDLRRTMSDPAAFRRVVAAYADAVRALDDGPDRPDLLAAVPYAALPVAGAVALTLARPLIYPRKEVKTHGARQAVEGRFEPGQIALLIEDVVTSGGSILTAAETLRAAGLRTPAALVLVDREQGGATALAAANLRLHAVTTLSALVGALRTSGRISPETAGEVNAYLAGA
jgi:uridine monophosphate synthetase